MLNYIALIQSRLLPSFIQDKYPDRTIYIGVESYQNVDNAFEGSVHFLNTRGTLEAYVNEPFVLDMTVASNESTLWRDVAHSYHLQVLGRTFEKKGVGAVMQYYVLCSVVGEGFTVFAYHDDYFPTTVQQPWAKTRQISLPVAIHRPIKCLPPRPENEGLNMFFPKQQR